MVNKYLKAVVVVGALTVGINAFAASVGIPCDGPECQACDLVKLGQSIITWLIGFSSAIIAFMFAWGGMQMVISGGEASGISKGKETMWNSLIGFLILLASWLIVDTFLKMFMSGASYGVWNEVQCVAQPAKTAATQTGPGTVTTSTSKPTVGANKLSDTDARGLLNAAGIGVNKTKAEGTSLEGINAATIKDAIDLKKECNCAITITGGTEGSGGHALGTMSHGTGYKYDIRLNNELDTYITKNYESIGTRSDGAPQYRAPDGTIYAKEQSAIGGPHWDVKVPG